MKINLEQQLCIDIYNYIETKPSSETGIMFAMLKQEMEKQTVEQNKKDYELFEKLKKEQEKPTEPKQEVVD